jgi:hypothetical protein
MPIDKRPKTTVAGLAEAIEDLLGNTVFTDTTSVDFTYNDGGNQITADVIVAGMTDGTATPTMLGSLNQIVANSGNSAITSDGSRYLYTTGLASAGNSEFQVWDIFNPAAPVKNSTLAFTGTSPQTPAVIHGGYAYLGYTGSASLPNKSIIDIRNPNAPTSVFQSANTAATLHNIENGVQGKYWYLVDQTNANVLTYDVSEPAFPNLLSTVAVGTATPVGGVIQGRYLYVACNGGRLVVFDLDVPGTPVSVASIATGNSVAGIDVSGKIVALARTSASAIELYDVSDPTTPVLLSTISSASTPIRANIVGRYLYMQGGSSSSCVIRIYDISNPLSATLAASYTPNQNGAAGVSMVGLQMHILGNRIYFPSKATGNTSFEVIDLKGLELRSGYIDSLEAGQVRLRQGLTAHNVHARNSMSVGSGGLMATGPLQSRVEFESPIYRSYPNTVASAGTFRMGNNESISWRNAANDGDESINLSPNDRFVFSGPLVSECLSGSQSASGNLELKSTTDATKGSIVIKDGSSLAVTSDATFISEGGPAFTESVLDVASNNGGFQGISVLNMGVSTEAATAVLNLVGGRGTYTTPLYALQGDRISNIVSWSSDNSDYYSIYSGGIEVLATENHSVSAHGTEMLFSAIPIGSTSSQQVAKVTGQGSLVLDSAHPIPAATLALLEGYSGGNLVSNFQTLTDIGPGNAGVNIFRARGSFASPDYLDADDSLYYVFCATYNGTAIDDANPANINIQATEDHASNVLGTKISFESTANGAASPVETLRLHGAEARIPGYAQFTANGDPGAQTNAIAIGAKDASTSALRTLHLRTEEAVSGAPAAADAKVKVWINNVEYYLHLTAV